MRTSAQPEATRQTPSAKSTSPDRGYGAQRRDANSIVPLQRALGNQAVLRMLRIQTKLALTQPGDEHEQEADHVADHVMRMPDPRRHGVSRVSSHTDTLALGPQRLQTKHAGPEDLGSASAPPLVHDVLRSPGQPLHPAARAFMEPRFGHDFSRVRVHSDAAAQQSAQEINAHAYTVGHNIVFNAGRFAPATPQGQRLLAHELTHVVQQSSGAALRVARQPTYPPHQKGYAGEQDMGFIHYRQQDDWIIFDGPSGSAGHGTTEPGFDAVAYNTRTGEIHLTDNKSLARSGNVSSATAIDPSRNLAKNVDTLIADVEAAKNVPGRIRLLGRLRALKSALAQGKPIPEGINLKVTGVRGNSTGVTQRLKDQGVEFLPEPQREPLPARSAAAPRRTAPAPAAPPKPAPAAPTPEPHAAPPTAKPPATAPEPPVTPSAAKPPATAPEPPVTPSAAKPPATPVEPPVAPPVAPPAAEPPIRLIEPPTAPPAVSPSVRPPVGLLGVGSPWRAGLKAGATALGVALIFAGLDYLVRRRLEKDLEASIARTRIGAFRWAARLKVKDPTKPVYLSLTVSSEDYSRYIPFAGWMPEPPKLHMTAMALVREPIDPPIVQTRDDRMNLFHPGTATEVTYTEVMIP